MNLLQIKSLIKGIVSLGLIAYLVTIIDWHDIKNLSPVTALLIFLGSLNTLLVLFFMTWRWSLLVKSQSKLPVSLKTAYQGYLTGSFYNMITPGAIGGDVVRIKYGRDNFGIDLKSSAMIVMIERITGAVVQSFVLLIGLGVSGFMLLADQFDFFEIVLGGLAGVLICGLFWFFKRKLQLPFVIAGKVFVLSFFAQSIDLVISTIFLFFLWPDAKFFWLLIVMPLSFFVTALPISLSGLGVRESVMVGVLRLFHVDASMAVIFSLMLYFSKVPVALLGGILVFLKSQKKPS
jgi:uncharacterized membrane protein YbhN (UPF0104 family)